MHSPFPAERQARSLTLRYMVAQRMSAVSPLPYSIHELLFASWNLNYLN